MILKLPKEIAQELVDNFYDQVDDLCGRTFFDEHKLSASKKFALKTVDEIIKYSPNKPDYEFDPIEYFNKVKQEIEKL
jgi:hypothetical protein